MRARAWAGRLGTPGRFTLNRHKASHPVRVAPWCYGGGRRAARSARSAQRGSRRRSARLPAAAVPFFLSRSSVAKLGAAAEHNKRNRHRSTATIHRGGPRARTSRRGDDLLLGAEAEAPAVRSEGPRDRCQFPHGDGWRALQPVAKRSPHPHPPHGLWAPEDRARGGLVARWVRGVRVRPAGDGHARVREPEAVRVDLFQILKGCKRLRRADRVGLR